MFRKRFAEEHLGLNAAGLTLTTLISLVPLLTVALALFTAFPIFSDFQRALEQYFLKSLVPPNIAKPVLGSLTQFSAKAKGLGAVGLVALGASALLLMLTIDQTLNQIWRVRRPRPVAQRVLVYWAALTLGPLLLGASLAFTSGVLTAGASWLGEPSTRPPLALWSVVDLLLLGAGMAALFRFVPNTEVRWRHALFGAAFVALAFELAKMGLAWYVRQVTTFSTLYGAFATVPIFLIWMYMGWTIVLLGAILAANAPALGSASRLLARASAGGAGQPLELALQCLSVLARTQRDGQAGLGQHALARRLHVNPLQLEPTLETLLALDWVGRLDESGSQRLVLLVDPHNTLARPLLAQLLVAPRGALEPLWRSTRMAALTLAEILPDSPR
ncbi:YihY family inner membrane protein [Roseateles sp. BYS180W]|uniref:YihY family inner membrane protein n=1 Tax=Roseateles rivi TaxID=3299028 RepID=UPI003748AE7B